MRFQEAEGPLRRADATTLAGFRRLQRLIIMLRLGLTLAVLLGAIGLVWYEQQQQLNHARSYADTTAATVADHTRASLDACVRALRLLEARGIVNLPAAQRQADLLDQLRSLPEAHALFLIDRAGHISAHTGGARGDVRERDFWAQGKGSKTPFLGHRQPGLEHFSDVLPLTLVLRDGRGFAGLLGASLAPDALADFFRQLKPQYDASYVLLRQGEPLLDTGAGLRDGPYLQVVRELPEYELQIELRIPTARILAVARGEVLRQLALALFLIVSVWIAGAMLLRHLERLHSGLYTALRAEAGLVQGSVAMAWVQPDGRLSEVNAAAARLLQRESADLERQHIHQLFQGLDAEAWRSHWRQLRQAGASHLQLDYLSNPVAEPETLALQISHITVDQREYALVCFRPGDGHRQADLPLRQMFRYARDYLALFRAQGGGQFVLAEANRPGLGSHADFDPQDLAILGAGEDLQQLATRRLGLKPAQVDFLHAMFRACLTACRPMSFGASMDLGQGEQYHTISLSPVVDARGAVQAVLLSVHNAEDKHQMLETLEQEVRRLQAELRARDRLEAEARDQARS